MTDEEWLKKHVGLTPVMSQEEIASKTGLTRQQVRTTLKSAVRKFVTNIKRHKRHND